MYSKSKCNKRGITLVEVMIAVVLVAVASVIVYSELLGSYRLLMRSRAQLQSQGLVFDLVWSRFNLPLNELPGKTPNTGGRPTASGSVLGTNGYLEYAVVAETNAPINRIDYWDVSARVWVAPGSPFSVGSEPLAEYSARRYKSGR